MDTLITVSLSLAVIAWFVWRDRSRSSQWKRKTRATNEHE
jgi:hypothetical protein